MVLKLSNGTELTVNDGSTINNIVLVVDNYATVDELTAENLNGATLDGETIANTVLDSISANGLVGNSIVVTINQHTKTESQIMQEQITELQEAIAELTSLLMGEDEEETEEVTEETTEEETEDTTEETSEESEE